MAARNAPTGGVGSNQYQTRGRPTVAATAARVARFSAPAAHESYTDEDDLERCDDCDEAIDDCVCACDVCGDRPFECACGYDPADFDGGPGADLRNAATAIERCAEWADIVARHQTDLGVVACEHAGFRAAGEDFATDAMEAAHAWLDEQAENGDDYDEAVSAAVEALPVAEVALGDVVSCQDTVKVDTVNRYEGDPNARSGTPPWAIEHNGQLLLVDGHHAILGDHLRGERTEVRVLRL